MLETLLAIVIIVGVVAIILTPIFLFGGLFIGMIGVTIKSIRHLADTLNGRKGG